MPAERMQLVDGGWISYDGSWLAAEAATDALRALIELVTWKHESIRILGRTMLQPRLTAWYGDADAAYTYSGLTLAPAPWIEPLAGMRRRLEDELGCAFNSVLCNRYRNGNDSMGFHADDEPELGREPLIASVSLGATRRFVLRHRRKGRDAPRLGLDLSHGSLLVMGGATQHRYRHAVPKQPDVHAERLNLTFRRVARPG